VSETEGGRTCSHEASCLVCNEQTIYLLHVHADVNINLSFCFPADVLCMCSCPHPTLSVSAPVEQSEVVEV